MKQKKKILVICQHFWPESFRINDICDFFRDKECEIDVLCGIPNYPKGKFYDGYSYVRNRKQVHNGINIRRVFEIPRESNTNFRIFLNYISFPIASLFHIPKLLTKKYDKIFLYQLSPVMMSVPGIITAKIKKIETTMYILDLWPQNLFSIIDVKNSFLKLLAEKVSYWHYKNVDKIVVLSEKMKKEILKITSLPESKIIVIPQCCEKLYENNIKDKELEKRFSKGFNIVFAGNISPAQSFETIVEAAEKLKNDGIDDINWIIIGDGMSRKWLEDTVKTKGLKKSFIFEGMKPMTDIPKYQPIADALIGCLVKSDLLEATIPAKVMSYFAAGRPMVLAMDGEVQELVNKIGCGFASNTEDAEALFKNIKKLYLTPKKERENMGKKGREYHFEHFERNKNLNRLYNFIFGTK